MSEMRQFEFFLLRYIPNPITDEFVNFGLVLREPLSGQVEVRFTRDWRRVRCLDPAADIEALEGLQRDLQGQGGMDRDVLLEKIQDLFSNTVQLSPSKVTLGASLTQELSTLASAYFDGPRAQQKREATGRQKIFGGMRAAFEDAGVWELMRKSIPAAQYTHKGDPLKIDCGYRPNGEIKLFQAVSLATDVDAAKVLAFSFPEIEAGIGRKENAPTKLTAIVEDELDRSDEAILFALATLEKSRIEVAGLQQMAGIAEIARVELRA